MTLTLHSPSIYPEIITHTTLDLMTKLTEYNSPAKQEAKIEAQRRNAEVRELQKQLRIWEVSGSQNILNCLVNVDWFSLFYFYQMYCCFWRAWNSAFLLWASIFASCFAGEVYSVNLVMRSRFVWVMISG